MTTSTPGTKPTTNLTVAADLADALTTNLHGNHRDDPAVQTLATMLLAARVAELAEAVDRRGGEIANRLDSIDDRLIRVGNELDRANLGLSEGLDTLGNIRDRLG